VEPEGLRCRDQADGSSPNGARASRCWGPRISQTDRNLDPAYANSPTGPRRVRSRLSPWVGVPRRADRV